MNAWMRTQDDFGQYCTFWQKLPHIQVDYILPPTWKVICGNSYWLQLPNNVDLQTSCPSFTSDIDQRIIAMAPRRAGEGRGGHARAKWRLPSENSGRVRPLARERLRDSQELNRGTTTIHMKSRLPRKTRVGRSSIFRRKIVRDGQARNEVIRTRAHKNKSWLPCENSRRGG